MIDQPAATLPVRRVVAREDLPLEPNSWLADVPAVTQLLTEGLEFGAATVLVGENGAGKSTLVEAIAIAYGLSAEGGTRNISYSTYASESDLHRHIRLSRGIGTSRWGFFLRAETMHGLFTHQITKGVGARDDPNFHEMSHGQSFRALLKGSRFNGPGLYVFDEPESALSFSAQLGLVSQIMDMMAQEGSQVILSTHSPVLASPERYLRHLHN